MKIIERNISPEEQALNDEVKSFIRECTAIPNEVDIIHHYTNIEALFNGIIVKEPKKEGEEICLWASNCLYMNDRSEMIAGQEYVNKVLKEYFIEDEGCDKKAQGEEGDMDYYITSFSMANDSLQMWGMYGKNGAGIALGFDRAVIEKNNLTLYRCSYLNDKLKEKVNEFCKKLKREKISQRAWDLVVIITLFALLLNENKKQSEEMIDAFIPFLLFMIYAKAPAYKDEYEVRLLIHSDQNSKIKYRVQKDLIVPYIENYFPKEALKTVLVGPTNDMKRTVKSLKTYLDHMGFTDVDIIPSEVPYRG